MDYIRGKTLSEIIKKEQLSNRKIMELMSKIALAISEAHKHKIVHRDLKPANVMIDESGEPVVMDFGVARMTDVDIETTTMHTEMGMLVGTLAISAGFALPGIEFVVALSLLVLGAVVLSGRALGTGAEEVEPMGLDAEAGPRCGAAQRTVEARLRLRAE